jgi:hypothetical protein
VPRAAPRRAEKARRQDEIVRHLEDFPRQYTALEAAMTGFGPEFDLATFKAAFNTAEDMAAYNRVQALERAMTRVQNYVAQLAIAGVKLTGLPTGNATRGGSPAELAFRALRAAKVISPRLGNELIRAQRARTRIEHMYVRTNAGDVHQSATLIHKASRDFIGPFRAWIEPHIRDG